MINKIRRYFFPRRKLHQLPKHISAEYTRRNITTHQAIIMMAGLALDPAEAQFVYDTLREQHGDKVWQYVRFEARRRRSGTFKGRLMKLMRRIFGENERPNLRYRKDDPVIFTDYRMPD